MKKILALSIFSISFFGYSQIKTNQNVSQNDSQNYTPFLDASSSSYWNGTTNNGKGLVFPRTDLTTLERILGPGRPGSNNAPTRYDGMVVYNIGDGTPRIKKKDTNQKVTPGFYYYKNDSGDLQGGEWVRIGGEDLKTGVSNGVFWTLSGNLGTTEASLEKPTTPEGEYVINGGDWIGTKDEKSLTIGTKNIARLVIGAKKETIGQTEFDFVMKVYGKARFSEGIVTSNSTYPDYVFDHYFTGSSKINPKYKFRTLAETEQFIKENNHLPGVTKIDELQKDGDAYMIDPTKLSVQSLEKVEELYLHTIQQQKEINTLKAELAEIKAMLKK